MRTVNVNNVSAGHKYNIVMDSIWIALRHITRRKYAKIEKYTLYECVNW